jgi:hypothetical protein
MVLTCCAARSTSGVAAREIKNGIYYPRQNNMTDVASCNLFAPEDSVICAGAR